MEGLFDIRLFMDKADHIGSRPNAAEQGRDRTEVVTILRHYLMTAGDGREGELRKVLQDLANKVRPLPGCEGVELYQDPDAETRFIFLERWTSAGAHRDAGKSLGRDVFAPVMAALAKPPEGSYFKPVPTED